MRPLDPTKPIRLDDLAAVVKASAINRLGMPLVKLYAALAIFGIVVVAIFVGVMYFG